MITMYKDWKTDISSPSRMIKGKAELYKNSALSRTFNPQDVLSSIKIERTPTQGKFFGFSVSQKVNIVLLDKNGDIEISKGDEIKPYIGTEKGLVAYPKFTITEVVRDEVKKQIKVTGFDVIAQSEQFTQKDLNITFPTTLKKYGEAIALKLGTKAKWILSATTFIDLSYTAENKPNFGGEETLRSVLTQLAEATGTIVYADKDNNICFKQLNSTPIDTIEKSQYFSLGVSKALYLSQVTNATELGDNVTAGIEGGFNQILHENGFFNLYPDITSALNRLVDMYKVLPLYTYNLTWRGNPALEIGDCVALVLNNNSKVNIPYLGETLNYTGGLKAISSWKEDEQKSVSSNPTKLGEALKHTFAKVDKVNKQIDLVASETAENTEAISQINIKTDSIDSSVKETIKKADTAIDSANKAVVEANKASQSVDDKIGNLKVGGRNLLLDSGIEHKNAEYRIAEYIPSRILEVGEKLTISVCVTPADKVNNLIVYNSGGYCGLVDYLPVKANEKQIVSATFSVAYDKGKTPTEDINNNNIHIYRQPNDGTVTGETIIHWVKLEKGTVATDWLQAPEDIENDIESNANNIQNTNNQLERLEESQNATDSSLVELEKEVRTKMTSEEMKIEINKAMSNGVDKVTTSTGFSFNENGLDITKSGSEMSTTVNEDGMRINKNGQTVLTANNTGVDATNLHATTWLIIGNNSRIEDYGTDRTGVFWIGN